MIMFIYTDAPMKMDANPPRNDKINPVITIPNDQPYSRKSFLTSLAKVVSEVPPNCALTNIAAVIIAKKQEINANALAKRGRDFIAK